MAKQLPSYICRCAATNCKENAMMTDDSEFAIAHEIWAAAQLAQGEGIEDGANRIAAILERLAPEVCSAQNAESERQDGLSLTDATQKEAQEPVGCIHRDYTGTYYVEPTRPDIARHLGKELFSTPQPPAPCPKCAEHIEYGTRNLRRRSVELAEVCADRDALQAKVAEQSEEIGRLTKERDEYNSAWQRSGVEYRKLRDSLLSLAGEFK